MLFVLKLNGKVFNSLRMKNKEITKYTHKTFRGFVRKKVKKYYLQLNFVQVLLYDVINS